MKKLLGSTMLFIRKKAFLILAGIGIALVSSFTAYTVTSNHYTALLTKVHPVFLAHNTFTFINPLLGISLPSDAAPKGYQSLRADLASVLAKQPAGTVTRYGVYFRDLNSGNWIGLNENEQFDPASLLKVVATIAAYRQDEDYPGFLKESLQYTKTIDDINVRLPFAQSTDLKVGEWYPVPYLIKKELVDSDNGAVYLLLNAIRDDELQTVYDGLNIPAPTDANPLGYKISPFEYSRFFRILYNGTFNLTWHDTDAILAYLSQSTFTSGLVAGVPSNVPIAHKYGEHVNGSNGIASQVELADCGIIYYPKRPYFLCVMTEGKDPVALADVIAQISKAAYGHVDANKD